MEEKPAPPVTRHIECATTGDDELDIVALCLTAMAFLPDVNAKARVAQYLIQRFPEHVCLDPEVEFPGPRSN